MSKPKYFQIFNDNDKIVNILSNEDAGRLFKALFAFVNSGTEPDFSDNSALYITYTVISEQIKRDYKAYNHKCQVLKKNAKKRYDSANACKCSQDNDKDKDEDKVEEEKASDDSEDKEKEEEDKFAEKEARCAELEAKCAELEAKLSELEKFKADTEEKEKMSIVNQTLAQVKESMDSEIYAKFEEQAKEKAEQVISQIDTMKKAILARAFRGELGTNDPSEPPADIGIS